MRRRLQRQQRCSAVAVHDAEGNNQDDQDTNKCAHHHDTTLLQLPILEVVFGCSLMDTEDGWGWGRVRVLGHQHSGLATQRAVVDDQMGV